MITNPRDLVTAAKTAGIKVPPYPLYMDPLTYSADEFPHWFLFVNMQLDRPLPQKRCEWGNAEIIASLTEDEANSITEEQLYKKGFLVGFPSVINRT